MCSSMLVWLCSHVYLILSCMVLPLSSGSAPSVPPGYARARQIRCTHGHDEACPFYQQLLRENPEDLTSATRLAASPEGERRLQAFAEDVDKRQLREFRQLLQHCGYSSRNIGVELFDVQFPEHRLSHASCPIYLTPAAAGTIRQWTFKEGKPPLLQCLVSLFLLGVAVPISAFQDSSVVQLLLDLRLAYLCDHDSTLLVGYMSVFPIDLPTKETLFIATDWHPRVLSLVQIEDEEAVMYIGPDSLALVQHFIFDCDPTNRWLDLCSGSGIQALTALKSGKCLEAVCVDFNPRALKVTAFNAALNDLKVETIHGNLLTNRGRPWRSDSDFEDIPLNQLLQKRGLFGVVSANPPFLPVPPMIEARRHGLFSAGGSRGDNVLIACIRTAETVLEDKGLLALVSEFFFDENRDMGRLRSDGKSLLLTNEFPISAELYSERRADSLEEFSIWQEHLASLGIRSTSPGLLFVKKSSVVAFDHVQVPKSSSFGSIWTPSNPEGISFSRNTRRKYLRGMG